MLLLLLLLLLLLPASPGRAAFSAQMVSGFKHERRLKRQRLGLELLLLALPPRQLIEQRCHLLWLLTPDLLADPGWHRWDRLAPLPDQLWRLQRWGRWLDAALPPPPPPVVLDLADLVSPPAPLAPS